MQRARPPFRPASTTVHPRLVLRHRRRLHPLALALFLLLAHTSTLADTRYVSHSGSNTYPYDSWATATDTVARAIEAAAEWDTVLVGPGEFESDSLRLKTGMAFIGSGMDSTRIRFGGASRLGFILADSITLEGVHAIGWYADTTYILIFYSLEYAAYGHGAISGMVRGNRFAQAEYGVFLEQTDLAVPRRYVSCENNEFHDLYTGIRFNEASGIVRYNRFAASHANMQTPVVAGLADSVVFEGNSIIRTTTALSNLVDLTISAHIAVRNNIIVSPARAGGWSARVGADSASHPIAGEISNNLLLGSQNGLACASGDLVVRNNIIIGTWGFDLVYADSPSAPDNVRFNLFWNNPNHLQSVDTTLRLAYGNVFADPMFLDSLDFHLQAFSPAIDAGDTLLLDLDGSRSDIGPFGGPYGETYAYQDLPPRTPELGPGQLTVEAFGFEWSGNYEADFDRYEFERSPIPTAAGDSFEVIAVLPQSDSTYTDSTMPGPGDWWYRVRAFDKQGNASEYSAEFGVLLLSVEDDPTLPGIFALHPNYPNPFNAQTRIEYALAEPSYVTLTVYDVLGRRIETLVHDPQPAGEHSFVWNAQTLGSGVYFLVLETPTDRRVQKALLLK